jgi:hypothetical protein
VIDGTTQSTAPLVLQNGVAQATLSTRLPPGTHTATATYNGNSTLTTSVSNTVSVAVAPAPGDGPTVQSLVRLGVHAQPTSLVLTFDRALDPARARNLANYKLIQPNGRPVGIASVRYNPSALTVTILPAKRLDLHQSYKLTVVGVPPTGLTDTNGLYLDGALTGQPGSNFVATITSATLSLPQSPKARPIVVKARRR